MKRRGHTVVIATSEVYRAKVAEEGLEFAPVRPDIGPLEDDADFLKKLWDPRKGPGFLIRDYLLPLVEQSYEDLIPAFRGADLALTHAAITQDRSRRKCWACDGSPSLYSRSYFSRPMIRR